MTKQAIYLREWRRRNPHKASEHNKRYRKKHPDRVAEQRAKEKAKYVKKGRYRVSQEHKKEVRRKYVASWRKRNPKRAKDIAKKSYIKNKTRWQVYGKNYKGKKRAGDDKTINPKALKKLLNDQDNKCAIGGELLEEHIELDHILPISKGGRHTLENVQWVCRSHNRRKGNKQHVILS